MNISIIEKKANDFRKSKGLSLTDPIRIKSLLSKLNVITVFKPLSSKFSGMAIKTGDYRFMLINSTHSLGKQHFTVCHELYHLYIQEDFSSMICNTGKFNSRSGEEFNADRFAALLLMPENAIMDLIPDSEIGKDKIKLETILMIENYFSCSRSALLYRLKGLKLITGEFYDSFSTGIKRNAIAYGYPTNLYEAGNDGLTVGDYGVLARTLYDENLISETHYLSLLFDLGMNEAELKNLFEENEQEEA